MLVGECVCVLLCMIILFVVVNCPYASANTKGVLLYYFTAHVP